MPKTAHAAFDTFIKSPQIQELLDGGNQIGPLNLMVRAIARNEDLMDLFMDIAIENQNISRRLAPSTIAKVIFEGKLWTPKPSKERGTPGRSLVDVYAY